MGSRPKIIGSEKFLEFWNPLIKSYHVATRNAPKTRFSQRVLAANPRLIAFTLTLLGFFRSNFLNLHQIQLGDMKNKQFFVLKKKKYIPSLTFIGESFKLQ